MSEADRAHIDATREIARVYFNEGTELDLSISPLAELDKIPINIATLKGLSVLDLSGTNVSDLKPIGDMTSLQILNLTRTRVDDLAPLAAMMEMEELYLDDTPVDDLAPLADIMPIRKLGLNRTKVTDLRPIRGMALTKNTGPAGLNFLDTPATYRDGILMRLSLIEDEFERTRQTLAYLNTLPLWPEPCTPETSGDGSPPAPIGAIPEPPAPLTEVRTAETHIKTLLRNALVTRVTAATLSAQIAGALQGVPATQGNELVPILQMMAEVGEVLGHLADDRPTDDSAARKRQLLLRIAQLEAIVARLTTALGDADKAREAAEALAQKTGFMASFSQSAGTAAGAGIVTLIAVGVPTAAAYFLGVDNRLVKAFLTVIGNLPGA